MRTFLQEKGFLPEKPLVLLHPGTRWETKQWEEEKWAALGDWLQKTNGTQVVFTGSANDAPLIERVISKMNFPGITTAGFWNLTELAFLQKQAEVVIIPDSGPMHLASAMGTPVVALFGPTEPMLTGPQGGAHRVVRKTVACQPCFKRKCASKQCMKEITVKEVYEATEAFLSYPNQAN